MDSLKDGHDKPKMDGNAGGGLVDGCIDSSNEGSVDGNADGRW